MTTYRGCIAYGHAIVVVHDDGAAPYRLDSFEANRLRPSCTGFGWGYSGAGSNCLALALLLDVTRDDRVALEMYRDFALTFVRDWPARWEISSAQIEIWVGIQTARGGVA